MIIGITLVWKCYDYTPNFAIGQSSDNGQGHAEINHHNLGLVLKNPKVEITEQNLSFPYGYHVKLND